MASSSLFQLLGLRTRSEAPVDPPPAGKASVVVRVGAANYLLGAVPLATVPSIDGPARYLPATVIHKKEGKLGDEEVELLVDDFGGRDDVWSDHFLQVIVLVAPSSFKANNEFKRGSKLVRPNHQIESKDLPSGPYMLHSSSGTLHSVYRLFDDNLNAFVAGVAPRTEPEAAFAPLESIDSIAVPSRLYSPEPTTEHPLEGLRFAVKDVIDVAGLRTGCGSAAWREFYPVVENSAPFIDQLLDKGAVLIGKLHCGQLGDTQDPIDRFEELAPTNPRGDGFQKPGGSSPGPETSVAGYPWLDFAVGTDNGVSNQHPAGLNGVYSIRPSLDSVKTKGVISSPSLDSISIFSRSTLLAESVLRCISDPVASAAEAETKGLRFRLLYAVQARGGDSTGVDSAFFMNDDRKSSSVAEACALFESFVHKLENRLDCQRQTLCLSDLWRDTRPESTPQNMTASMSSATASIVYKDLSRNVATPFITEYRTAHENKMPYIEPVTKARLHFGASVSDDQYSEAKKHLESYGEWINSVLLSSPAEPVGGGNEAAPEKALADVPILISPQSWGTPKYRDEPRTSIDGNLASLGASSIAACSGCPQAVVPVGEAKFVSKVTETDEYLPVSVSILAPKGLDGVLGRVLTDMEKDGELAALKCGSRVF